MTTSEPATAAIELAEKMLEVLRLARRNGLTGHHKPAIGGELVRAFHVALLDVDQVRRRFSLEEMWRLTVDGDMSVTQALAHLEQWWPAMQYLASDQLSKLTFLGTTTAPDGTVVHQYQHCQTRQYLLVTPTSHMWTDYLPVDADRQRLDQARQEDVVRALTDR